MASQENDNVCTLPPAGWLCTRAPGHLGPCAAVPIPAVLTLEDAFRAGFAAAEEALGAHGSDHLLDSIERAWTDYADDHALVSA